jgi:hypothetical protein
MDYQAEYWKSKYIESLEDNSKLYGQLADVRLKINSLHEQLGPWSPRPLCQGY